MVLRSRTLLGIAAAAAAMSSAATADRTVVQRYTQGGTVNYWGRGVMFGPRRSSGGAARRRAKLFARAAGRRMRRGR